MPDASVPITLSGKVYQLRYTYPDFKAMEKALGVGYVHFARDEIFKSITAQEIFLWCGLKQKEKDGSYTHIFPQTPDGQEQAGEMLWKHLRETGDLSLVVKAVSEAFVTTGPWKLAEPQKPNKKQEKTEPKNSQT